jgi:hypothetical protein
MSPCLNMSLGPSHISNTNLHASLNTNHIPMSNQPTVPKLSTGKMSTHLRSSTKRAKIYIQEVIDTFLYYAHCVQEWSHTQARAPTNPQANH